MEGKGKLICKVGQVVLLLEDYGNGEVFRIGLLADPHSDEIAAAVTLEIADASFLERSLRVCIDTLYSHNIKKSWYESEQT